MTGRKTVGVSPEAISAGKKRGWIVAGSVWLVFLLLGARDQQQLPVFLLGVTPLFVLAVALGGCLGTRGLKRSCLSVTDGDAIEFQGMAGSAVLLPLHADALRIRAVRQRTVFGTVGSRWQLTNAQGAQVFVPQSHYPDLPAKLTGEMGLEDRVLLDEPLESGFLAAAVRAALLLAGFVVLVVVFTATIARFDPKGSWAGAIGGMGAPIGLVVALLWRWRRRRQFERKTRTG